MIYDVVDCGIPPEPIADDYGEEPCYEVPYVPPPARTDMADDYIVIIVPERVVRPHSVIKKIGQSDKYLHEIKIAIDNWAILTEEEKDDVRALVLGMGIDPTGITGWTQLAQEFIAHFSLTQEEVNTFKEYMQQREDFLAFKAFMLSAPLTGEYIEWIDETSGLYTKGPNKYRVWAIHTSRFELPLPWYASFMDTLDYAPFYVRKDDPAAYLADNGFIEG